MTPTEPGVYFELSLEDYLAIPALSSHGLSELRRSPAHLRAYLDGGLEDRVDPDGIGRALHALVLEGEGALDGRYTQAPAELQDRRSKAWKELEAAELEAGRVLMLARDFDAVLAMRDGILASPAARLALRGLAATELSLVWIDPRTGVLLKARIDGLNPTILAIVDLKSAADASPRAFSAAVWRYGYHRQLALYRAGVRALALGDYREPVLLAYEKEPPYVVVAYRIEERAIAAATLELWGSPAREGLVPRYARCLESGKWPGYSEAFETVSLPGYAWRDLEKEGLTV